MKRVLILALVIFLLFTFATNIFAQKVNFSGTWKYNADKSEIPDGIRIPVPESITFTQKDNILTTATGTEEKLLENKYTLDGKKVINKSSKGTELTSFCKWDGDTLIIETTRPSSYGEFKTTEKFSLSKDGKTITKVMTTNMTFDQELIHVYDKVK
ncbi:hypothetical protein ACFL4T_13000 [candidate division KSB1 bacterium]